MSALDEHAAGTISVSEFIGSKPFKDYRRFMKVVRKNNPPVLLKLDTDVDGVKETQILALNLSIYTLLGTVSLTPDEASRTASLSMLFVSPPMRRQGVATALVTQAERIALSEGATVMRLLVQKNNLAAHLLYARLGYIVLQDYDEKDYLLAKSLI